MKKILLIGHSGFYNRGCEAIVRGTVAIIKHFLPESRIILASGTPDLDIAVIQKSRIAVDQVFPTLLSGYQKASLPWLWQTIDRRILSGNPNYQEFLWKKWYKWSDLVISIGGDNFSDDYGSPKRFFESLRYAKQLGKKTVIWGASVGPFKENVDQWSAILRSCDLITAREENTVAYLKTLGCGNNLLRVSDPAFCMPYKAPAGINGLKKAEMITVGLGISDLIPKYGISRSKHSRIFAAFIGYLRAKYDASIMLVPHVIQPGGEEIDDYRACNEVMEALPDRKFCQVLPDNLDATEFKYCIAQCDYFIGARTHSTIASLSSQVPTGSIGYSVKATGINMDLLGTDNYVLTHSQLSLEGLVALFEKLTVNRKTILKKLKVEVPLAQERAMRAGEFLANIIE